MEPDLHRLIEHLSRLQREQKRTQMLSIAGFGFLGLAIIALALFATRSRVPILESQPPQARIVEAEQFIVKDPQGRRRAQLGFFDGQPGLAMFGDTGRQWLFLGAVNFEYAQYGQMNQGSSSLLRLFDNGGNARVDVGADAQAGGSLLLSYQNGKPLLEAGTILPHGGRKQLFAVYHDNGRLLLEAGGTWYGGPLFSVYDEDGNTVQTVTPRR